MEVERGTGKIYVKKEGTVFQFCSGKCERNLLKLGRAPQFTEWTASYKKLKQSNLKIAGKSGAK